MAKTYFSLITRDDWTSPWGVQFGDWDRDNVDSERELYIESGHRSRDLKIITTNGSQAAIDTKIAELNLALSNYDATPLTELDALFTGAKPAASCQWFALCTNPATTTLPHPVLGNVAACQRCAAKAARLGKTPKTAPRTIQEINSSETKDDRYAIYVRCVSDLGQKAKTYEEWLRS